jgi:hypothetical protein
MKSRKGILRKVGLVLSKNLVRKSDILPQGFVMLLGVFRRMLG